MPLETIEQGPNIRELTLKPPEKRKEYLFDPYKDIPENVWKELLVTLKTCRGELSHQPAEWLNLATALKILRPDRASELCLDEETEAMVISAIEVVYRALTQNIGKSQSMLSDGYLEALYKIEILWPRSKAIAALEVFSDVFQRIVAEIKNEYGPNSTRVRKMRYILKLGRLTVTSRKNSSLLELPNEDAIDAALVSLQQGLYAPQKMEVLALLRILFPDIRLDRIRPLINVKERKQFDLRHANDFSFLAIISADKVIVDDTGLHLEFNHERKAPVEEVSPPPTPLKL